MIVPWIIYWSGEGSSWVDICPYTHKRSLFRADNRGNGKPFWKEYHPNRQRKCVYECRCQVCGGSIVSRTKISLGAINEGTVVDPFVCVPCAKMSLAMCPDLKDQIEEGEIEIKEVTGWKWFPHYWADQEEIVQGFGIELKSYIDRDRDWLNGQEQ